MSAARCNTDRAPENARSLQPFALAIVGGAGLPPLAVVGTYGTFFGSICLYELSNLFDGGDNARRLPLRLEPAVFPGGSKGGEGTVSHTTDVDFNKVVPYRGGI